MNNCVISKHALASSQLSSVRPFLYLCGPLAASISSMSLSASSTVGGDVFSAADILSSQIGGCGLDHVEA